MSGRDTLKERSTKPVKVAESDIDVSISHCFRNWCCFGHLLVLLIVCIYYSLWDKILLVGTFLLKNLMLHMAIWFYFQVKLSVFCEQDRILQDLEDKIRALKENKVRAKRFQ